MTNDERILQLTKQIKQTKTDLIKYKQEPPRTNCIIDFPLEKSYNIHTLRQPELVMLLVKLNGYKEMVASLNISDATISGYSVDDWIADIKDKIEAMRRAEKKKALDKMEKDLSKMLSDDKKTELAIDEIADKLKNM